MNQTLLLNASYEPMGVISWQRAVELLVGEKIVVLETYDEDVRSAYLCFKMPAVVALKRYVNRRPKVKFSRKNIYLRDEFTCQYCSVTARNLPGGTKDLTFDHVLPRCQGGITSWTNIATACFGCNHRKGGRTPVQAKMHLIKKPTAPGWLPMFAVPLHGRPSTPDQWKSYLYWESELDES